MAATAPQTPAKPTAKPAAGKANANKKVKYHYVYSTSSSDTVYGQQEVARQGEAARPGKVRVLIKGGANVLNKRLQTARGVATKVTQDELEYLLQDKKFQKHVKAGFISHSAVYEDPEEVAKGMQAKDGSAQAVDGDFAVGSKPKTGPAALDKDKDKQ